MRAIDFWIGIPICFLLTVVYRIQRLFGFQREPASAPENILFIQLAEMGTMVVAYPALRKVRELFPNAALHFLCFKQIRSSVEILEIIDPQNIIVVDAGSVLSLARDTLLLPWRARRKRIDTVVNMEMFVRYSTIVGYLTGARRRVGFHRFNQEGLYTGNLLTHRVLYNPQIHTAHTFLDLAHALVAPPQHVPRVKRPRTMDSLEVPRITTDAATAAHLWRKLEAIHAEIGVHHKLVVLNPNASELLPMRRMPLESYIALARHLLDDPDVFLLITGVAGEKPVAQHICARLNSPRALDLTGATTLRELVHLFNVSDVLISNDSGPAHFAALTTVHVIVFFGPETPERYRPLAAGMDVIYTNYSCSPCVSPFNQRNSPCNDNLCLKSVDIAAVCTLVRSRLDSAYRRRRSAL